LIHLVAKIEQILREVMRFAGDTFSRAESADDGEEDSLLTSYFPDLRNVYKPKFKIKAKTPTTTEGNSAPPTAS